MKNRQKSVFAKLFLIVAILLTAEKVQAKDFYSDGTIQEGDYYEFVDTWNNATVNMTGGEVTFLLTNEYSTLNMSGGQAWLLRSLENSVINFNGGTVTKDFSCRDNSTLNFNGGQYTGMSLWAGEYGTINFISGQNNDYLVAAGNATINFFGGQANALSASEYGTTNLIGGQVSSHIYADGYSTINIYGGLIGDDLKLLQESTIKIFGYDFAVDGIPFGYGELTSISGGEYWDESYRSLTGTLLSGESINNDFRIGHDARIILIPEPATVLLLGLGGLFLKRRRS